MNAVLDHFRAIHKAVQLPIMMYNVPVLTGIDVSPEDVKQLHDEGVLSGVKWSHIDIDKVQQTRFLCGPDFANFAGVDMLVFAALAIGAHGMICDLPMLVPRLACRLFDQIAEEQNLDTVRDLWMKLQRLIRFEYRALYTTQGEPHWLTACRVAAQLRGIPVGPSRPPLKGLSTEHQDELREILQELGEL